MDEGGCVRRATMVVVEGPGAYGDHFATVYDDWYDGITDTEATAAFVAARARSRPVLELGVGTGRVARALRRAGVRVVGLDASEAMARRANVGPAASPTIVGDMADLPVRPGGGRFGVVLSAFNTLFNVPGSGRQRGVLAGAARCVEPDGLVVTEGFVPGAVSGGREVTVARRGPGEITFLDATTDEVAQRTVGVHVTVAGGLVTRRPWTLHWLHPQQQDRLAAEAGLALVERYGDWQATPFGSSSTVAVSVYRPRYSPSR